MYMRSKQIIGNDEENMVVDSRNITKLLSTRNNRGNYSLHQNDGTQVEISKKERTRILIIQTINKQYED